MNERNPTMGDGTTESNGVWQSEDVGSRRFKTAQYI
jgi:hypothetical protein